MSEYILRLIDNFIEEEYSKYINYNLTQFI